MFCTLIIKFAIYKSKFFEIENILFFNEFDFSVDELNGCPSPRRLRCELGKTVLTLSRRISNQRLELLKLLLFVIAKDSLQFSSHSDSCWRSGCFLRHKTNIRSAIELCLKRFVFVEV